MLFIINININKIIKMKKIKKKNLLFPNYIKSKKSNSESSKKPPEKYESRQNIYYKPINPKHRFNPSTIGINEIIKKNNLSLITNNKLRNIILKFREERLKQLEEKKLLYKNKSFKDYEDDKKTRFIMLKALLRKDHQTIQSLLLKDNIKKNKKKNRIYSCKNLSYLGKNISSYRNNNSSLILSSHSKYLTSEKVSNNKSVIIKTKADLLKKEIFPKFERKKFVKKFELKIKSAYAISSGGKVPLHKMNNISSKKFNQDISFCLLNVNSSKLGEISLFGVFDGNGPHGKSVSAAVKEYIINYFINGTEMRVTLKRDNFYSIMYNSLVNAQNYIINNNSKLNINIDYSGVTGCILLCPHNKTNKVYCANLGRSKCMLYTMLGSIRLSYELYRDRASEKYRISLLKEKKDKIIITSNNIEELHNLNKNDENKNNIDNKSMTNNINENSKDLNQKLNEHRKSKIDEKEKDNFLKEFCELDISRCIGNLAAEDQGIIPGPEIVESDIRINKGKFIVIGTSSLWKYLTDDEIGEIVNKYLAMADSLGACKELEETAKERWKSETGGYDDISVIVVFFDLKNLDVIK